MVGWSASPAPPNGPGCAGSLGHVTAPGGLQPRAAGDRIADRYVLAARLASGGMAEVWRASDEVLARPVAIKVLHASRAADPSFIARFRREAVAAARLSHPNIVNTFDTCDDPEAIVMELVDGRTLRDELDRRGFLPPAEAVDIASEIARALHAAHAAGIVHRDVKPANVLLSSDGRVKVADFGIAKALRTGPSARSANDGGPGNDAGPDDDAVSGIDGAASGRDDDLPDLTEANLMIGTAKYLAPEQVEGGPVDGRTDVYGLGAVLYEMLCGRPPFTGDNDVAVATARLHRLPERPRSVLRTVPTALDTIVMRALATDPADRFDDADAVWAALQAAPVDAEEGGSVGAAAPADATIVGEAPSIARTERSWLVPTLLVSFVALALALAWTLIGGSDARQDLADLVDRVSPGGGDDSGDAAAVTAVRAVAFDPFGTDGEHDDQAAFAVDGDEGTAWTTERYRDRRFGGLKPGVGIVVDLGESVLIDEIRITTDTEGWAAQVYVSEQSGAAPEQFGDIDATVDAGGAGTTTVDLDGARGSFVLFWLTDLGDGTGVTFDLDEIAVGAA